MNHETASKKGPKPRETARGTGEVEPACSHWRETMRVSALVLGLGLMAALVLAALGEFCLFGFFASFEPGNSIPWRICYGSMAVAFFAGAIWLSFKVFGLRRTTGGRVVAGLTGGALAAFALAFGVFMIGPRSGLLGMKAGVVYGSLAAPIGAVVGGAWEACARCGPRKDRDTFAFRETVKRVK